GGGGADSFTGTSGSGQGPNGVTLGAMLCTVKRPGRIGPPALRLVPAAGIRSNLRFRRTVRPAQGRPNTAMMAPPPPPPPPARPPGGPAAGRAGRAGGRAGRADGVGRGRRLRGRHRRVLDRRGRRLRPPAADPAAPASRVPAHPQAGRRPRPPARPRVAGTPQR